MAAFAMETLTGFLQNYEHKYCYEWARYLEFGLYFGRFGIYTLKFVFPGSLVAFGSVFEKLWLFLILVTFDESWYGR